MCIAIAAFVLAASLQEPKPEEAKPPRLSTEEIAHAGKTVGLDFAAKKLELMQSEVIQNLEKAEHLRKIAIENALEPALVFSPLLSGMKIAPARLELEPIGLPSTKRPANLEDLAFASIPELASLVKSKQVSCAELVNMYLARLERLDASLHCVVNFTKERALAQAKERDAEIAAGKWRGMLHGLPWGAKDLLAVKGLPTTWGSPIYKQQLLDADAAVVKKLDDAGAILIAKLSLGEIAMGDLWFGGLTRNPWNLEGGSSGSSAGSASATVAGCVAFAIGSETLGSIVSPSDRCGATGLRPTFGRVSRAGAMALSWSMDKLGPLARSVEDAAIVFAAIQGPAGSGASGELDRTVIQAPFALGKAKSLRGLRVGVPMGAFDKQKGHDKVLDELKSLGVEIVDVELPKDVSAEDLLLVLTAEAATAFAALTETGDDDKMVAQNADAWPNIFRAARLISAVDYLRAQRLRTRLMRAMDEMMKTVDVYVNPSFATESLLITNLTGHPAVVAPDGFDDKGRPHSVTFTGRLFGESDLLAVARAWQEVGGYHRLHPKL